MLRKENGKNLETLSLAPHMYFLQRRINRYLKAGLANLKPNELEALTALLREAKAAMRADEAEVFEKREEQKAEELKDTIVAINELFASIEAIRAQNEGLRRPRVSDDAVDFSHAMGALNFETAEIDLSNISDARLEATCRGLFADNFVRMEAFGHGDNRVRALRFKDAYGAPAPSIFVTRNRLVAPVHEYLEEAALQQLAQLSQALGLRALHVVYPDHLASRLSSLQSHFDLLGLQAKYQPFSQHQSAQNPATAVLQKALENVADGIHSAFHVIV